VGESNPCVAAVRRLSSGGRGELCCPVPTEHEDADVERLAPPERFEADHTRGVQDHQAAKAMGSAVTAPGAAVLAYAVVHFEGTPLDDEPHPEAVRCTRLQGPSGRRSARIAEIESAMSSGVRARSSGTDV